MEKNVNESLKEYYKIFDEIEISEKNQIMKDTENTLKDPQSF